MKSLVFPGAALVVTTMIALVALGSCTRQQRAIVRTVVDFVDDVCSDHDSLDECLGKMQAMRAKQLGAIRDAGTD